MQEIKLKKYKEMEKRRELTKYEIQKKMVDIRNIIGKMKRKNKKEIEEIKQEQNIYKYKIGIETIGTIKKVVLQEQIKTKMEIKVKQDRINKNTRSRHTSNGNEEN